MAFVTAGLLSSVWATLLLAVILFACTRVGGLVLRAAHLGKDSIDFFEKIVFSTALGIIVLSLTVLAVGSSGYLTRTVMFILLAGFAALPLFIRQGSYSSFSDPLNFRPEALKPQNAAFVALTGAVVILSWVAAVSPPTGNDALAYHLADPAAFVLDRKIAHLPGTRASLWPYQTEMLYTVGLLLQGTALATLFHWIFLILIGCSVYLLAKRQFNEKVGRYAVIVLLFTPAVFAQAGQAYVDLSFAFYVLMGVYPIILVKKIGVQKAALLSGIFCGGALSTKYLALGMFGILFFLWVAYGKNWRACALFLTSGIAVSAVWYLRSWIVLGNPVYPFFHQLFAGNGYPSDLGEGVGMGRGFVSFFPLLWNGAMNLRGS